MSAPDVLVLALDDDGIHLTARTSAAARHAFRDLGHYTRLRPGDRVGWAIRRADIIEQYPSVVGDPADWLADDMTFARVIRDIIKVGLPIPHAGPRRGPTTAEAREAWGEMIAASRARRSTS